MTRDRDSYDTVSMALHWTIGIGILLLAGTELFRHEFPKGHFLREGLKGIHQPAGTVLFALILVRLAWRALFARIPRSAATSALTDLASQLVHLALYALMLALPLLGLLSVLGSGKAIDFGVFQLTMPLKESLGAYAKQMRGLHEILGVAILWLAGLHAVAALGHHYILRDGIMARMLPPALQRTSQPAAQDGRAGNMAVNT